MYYYTVQLFKEKNPYDFFKNILFKIHFVCRGVLSLAVYVHHVHAWFLRRSEDSITSLVLVRDGCEPSCGFWGLNLGLYKSSKWFYLRSSLIPPAPPYDLLSFSIG